MTVHDLDVIYKENLEQEIIAALANQSHHSLEEAMDIYYRSQLSRQIQEGKFGIENLDGKYLAEDLMENEAGLFVK